MSALPKHRYEQDWWADDAPTQAVPTGAVRATRAAATVPLRSAPVSHPRRAVARPVLPDPSKVLVMAALIGTLALLLYLGITGLVSWTKLKMDDLHYGRPRTSQLDAFIGHNESSGLATHFVAMNLNRRVTIIEFPGGDITKPQVIAGPYLFGRSEDLTVVTMHVQDVNGDDKPDLIVQVKDERLVYINDGNGFRPITADELARLKQTEGGR
jgi:hypothetical protein